MTPGLEVSTTAKDRRCFRVETRGYCGRTSAPLVDDWSDVVCADCAAAHNADLAGMSR